MEVIQMAVGDLKDYENNPRFNDEAVEYVANSIKEFGFKVPIIIDSDNVIVAGHTRKRAAMELGLEEVPVIVADDLTNEQIKAFRLSDNKVSSFSSWDFELLSAELDEIGIDMDQFGFDDELESVDLDNLWEEQSPDDNTVKQNMLSWDGNETPTTLFDERWLDEKYIQFTEDDPDMTFIAWLREEQ